MACGCLCRKRKKEKKKRVEENSFGPTASDSICLRAGELVGEKSRFSDQNAHSGEDRRAKFDVRHF